ncbi:FAD/NAD-binding domain-containing protein [Phellopilus nigrolimitatus]|nr:FAD/NAD-binding domain-containing protein [Phellopilus nigrolimitatus]
MISSRAQIQKENVAGRAELRLNFVVIGAGIAGLASAYSLTQAGHSVRILESENGIQKSPGGVCIPPNMTIILQQWGLGHKLEGSCRQVLFRSGYTGEIIGDVIYHEEVMKALEADYYLMRHFDLVNILYELAVDAGVHFDFGVQVTTIDPAVPSVALSSGEIILGDIIVGADGNSSIVRPILEDGIGIERDGAFTSYLFTVPKKLIDDDEEILCLIEDRAWNLWMGSDWVAFVYAVRGDSELAVSLFTRGKLTTAENHWGQLAPINELGLDNFTFEPRLERIMKLASDVTRVKSIDQTPLDSWFDNDAHLLVIGQAAHQLLPGSTQGAALAVEDAAVLGRLFSHLRSRDEIKRLLSAYQELRQQRCDIVQAKEEEKIAFSAMPSGPERDERDAHMREVRKDSRIEWKTSTDEYLRKRWVEEFEVLYGYNAFEAADTWWVEWGVLLERMDGKEAIQQNSGFLEQVSVEFTNRSSRVYNH